MENNRNPRQFEGVVTSDKMMKTVVVAVTRTAVHPKYQKRYQITNKFKAHSENNEYKTGDRVIIEETRPLSKDKKWKVVKLVAKSAIAKSE